MSVVGVTTSESTIVAESACCLTLGALHTTSTLVSAAAEFA